MNDSTKSILQLIDEKNALRRQLNQALLELEETRNSRARAYIEARREVAAEMSLLYRLVNGRLGAHVPVATPDRCEKCSIKLEPVMSYCCPRNDCPCGLGSVTSMGPTFTLPSDWNPNSNLVEVGTITVPTGEVPHNPSTALCACVLCKERRNKFYHADRTWGAPK